MKSKYILLLSLFLIGCSSEKLPRNQIETSKVNEVRFYNRQLTPEAKYVVRELDDIYEQIKQAKKLNLNRIYLIDGIYTDSYKEESEWSYSIQSIVWLLRQDGYKCEPFYKNIYGLIENNKTQIGFVVRWDEIISTDDIIYNDDAENEYLFESLKDETNTLIR